MPMSGITLSHSPQPTAPPLAANLLLSVVMSSIEISAESSNAVESTDAAETANTAEISNAAEISRLEKEVGKLQTRIEIKRLEHSIKQKQRKLSKLKKKQNIQLAAEKPANAGGTAVYDGEQFEIEAIMDRRARNGGGHEYLVRWKGWAKKFNEWIADSEMSLRAAELVDEFEKNEGK